MSEQNQELRRFPSVKDLNRAFVEKQYRSTLCVNACAGMTNEQISHGLVSASVHSATANARDELLVALESLYDACTPYADADAVTSTACDLARAAIAKARSQS